jgi:TonB family protein
MKFAIVAAIAIGFAAPAEAATITVSHLDNQESISIDGAIEIGDDIKFENVINQIVPEKTVVVILSGPGGNFLPGFKIGTDVFQRGWATRVEGDQYCASMCAYIWLAGKPRFVMSGSRIGFHAVYSMFTGKETGSGNAMLGGYLAKLGLSYEAIAFLTEAGPKEMTWLTRETSAKYGIDITYYKPTESPEPKLTRDPSWESDVVRHLELYKRYPSKALALREEGTVLLSFSLNRYGHVMTRRVARSSGYADLDDEVMDMILRADPLPAFRSSMPQSRLDFTVPIRFSIPLTQESNPGYHDPPGTMHDSRAHGNPDAGAMHAAQ